MKLWANPRLGRCALDIDAVQAMHSADRGTLVEAALHHIAVLHAAVLTFDTDLALRLNHGAGGVQIFKKNNLSLNEAALEVRQART